MPFDPEFRNIYTYYDGSIDPASSKLRQRRADPIALEISLIHAAGGQSAYDDLWKRSYMTTIDPSGRTMPDGQPVLIYTDEALASQAEFAKVVRQAFVMVAFDAHGDEGLTDREVLETLYAFYDYREKKRQTDASSPSTSQPIPDSASTTTL